MSLIALGAVAKPNGPAVNLTVAPITDQTGFVALDVAFSFTGDSDGESLIRLPDSWAGESKLYEALSDVRLDGGVLEPDQQPGQYRARHAPGAQLILRYRANPEKRNAAEQRGNPYRVQIDSKGFFALGNALVAQVYGMNSKTPARFTLAALPAGAQFASDLEHQTMGRALTVGDLSESVLIGGDIRVLDVGAGARIAIRGAIDQLDDIQWRAKVSAIIAAERAYWATPPEPFLVTILTEPPRSPGRISIGGTGRSDAFAFFASTNAEPVTVLQILAHEKMHTWVPRRIGNLPEGDVAQREAYWLSEGFTDWAMLRVMARGKLWDSKQVAHAFNEFLKGYDQSPWRAKPNRETAAAFWTDGQAQELPYRRGMLAATYWDHAVREKTNGKRDFDDVLWRMQALAKRRPNDKAPALLVRAMRDVARIDVRPDIARLIEAGEPAVLPADVFAPCGQIETIDRAAFDRGFDIEATVNNKRIVTGVRIDGPAYAAGLRDGMALGKRTDGEIGDSTVPISYDVTDNGVAKNLRWLPAGVGREQFRQLKLDPKRDEAACLARLGGL